MNPKPGYTLKSKKAFGIVIPLIFLILLALFIISLPRWAIFITVILGALALNALLGIILGPKIPRAKRRACDAIAEALGDKNGGAILDIGAGSGILTIHLAKAGFQATGVDIKEESLERARENAKMQGLEAVFRVNDGSSLEWPDGSFDGVTSLNLLHEARNAKAVLAESQRVLKPGGTLAMADFRRSPAIFPIFWVGIVKFLTRKVLLHMLQEVGFEEIQISRATLFHHLVVGRKKK